jgi:hypothetical protein
LFGTTWVYYLMGRISVYLVTQVSSLSQKKGENSNFWIFLPSEETMWQSKLEMERK